MQSITPEGGTELGARGAGTGTFRSLRIRNFRLFFGGQLVSQAGNWMTLIAQTLLVLNITHNGVAVGSSAGPGPASSYPPIGAPNPLTFELNGLACKWNVLPGTSFCAALEPVAIATCATAVSDGLVVTTCLA